MNLSTRHLLDDLDALVETVREALPAWSVDQTRFEPVGGDNDSSSLLNETTFEQMSDAGVVRVLEGAAKLGRRVDAVLVRAADEIARRSGPECGADGLAKQQGFHNAARLVAAVTGGAEAARLLSVGASTRARRTFSGELLPAVCAHARAGLDAGALNVDAAGTITGMLKRVSLRADPEAMEGCEAALVNLAGRAPLSLVARAARHAEAQLDADGVEPADEALHGARSLTFHEDTNGMFTIRGRLDPVSAAPVKAALDAMVGEALRCRERANGGRPAETFEPGSDGAPSGDSPSSAAGEDASVVDDPRSIPQIQADALSELARHVLGCSAAPSAAANTTVVVRLSLDALRDGIGLAEVDGVDRPISARTARRLAADCEVIPVVLGSERVPLDVGRTSRLFTRAQRIALAERDGGCASCGANITYAQAHHIQWWERDRGRTDLDNGVMLCSFCHHQVHRDGWGIRADRNSVWFIPPPHIDPDQRPRLGGRARFQGTLAAPPAPPPPPPPPPPPSPVDQLRTFAAHGAPVPTTPIREHMLANTAT